MARTTEEQAMEYVNDPATRVYIHFNDEIGEWRHSVVVDDSNGFWLDSFETEEEATDFIIRNNLKLTNPV